MVRGEVVGLALGEVKLLLPGVHVYVGVGQLAKINFRTRYRNTGHGALNGHVAEDQRGQPFRREAVDRIHGDAVTVGVDELLVDPVAAALGELGDVELARGQHHLADRAIDFIAIDVDVGKIVVGADFLDLTESVLQRAPVPKPDVLKCGLVVGRFRGLNRGLGRKLAA